MPADRYVYQNIFTFFQCKLYKLFSFFFYEMLNNIAHVYKVIFICCSSEVVKSVFNINVSIKIFMVIFYVTWEYFNTIYHSIPVAIIFRIFPNLKKFPEQNTPPSETHSNIKN